MVMTVLKLLFRMSVMGSIMIGIVLLIRMGMSRKMNPKGMIFLWSMVLLRLCLPITFTSPVYLSDFMPKDSVTEQIKDEIISTPKFEPYRSYSSNDSKIDMVDFQTSKLRDFPAATKSSSIENFNTSSSKFFIWIMIMGIWVSGVLLVVTVNIREAMLFRRKLFLCRPMIDRDILQTLGRHKKDLDIERRVIVLECNYIQTPAVFGYIEPSILLPTKFAKDMDKDRLNSVLLHEMCHIKRHDILTNYIWLFAKAMHWFNPLVWIAYRLFQDDVELCCDQMVVSRLSEDGRLIYSESLIEAARFSREEKKRIPSAVTSLYEKKSRLNDRVLRLINPQKRSRASALVSMMLALLMFIMCFTTACQPTPEKQIVVKKNGNEIDEKIRQSATEGDNGKSLNESMAIPAQWSDTFTNQNKKVSFQIDGEIFIPNTEKVPVAEVSPEQFTQEKVDRMIEILLGESQLYEPQGMTREQIEAYILKIKAVIAELKNESKTEIDDEFLAKYERELAIAESRYNATPKSLEKTPADSKLSLVEENGESYIGLNVMADTETGNMLFTVRNDKNYSYASLNERTVDGQTIKQYQPRNILEPMKHPKGVNISREEAQRMAIEIAQTLDPGLELAHTGIAASGIDEVNDYVWQMVFTRSVNGFTTSYETHEQGEYIEEMMTLPVPYEKMLISIDDRGIAEFQWWTPMRVDEIVNENVALMPFEEIQERAKEMLVNSFNERFELYTDDAENMTVYINYVTLGLARINVKDRPGEYKLIPVWDFYGYWDFTLKDTSDIPEEKLDLHMPEGLYSHYSLLTINAIDGSIIDRNRGY